MEYEEAEGGANSARAWARPRSDISPLDLPVGITQVGKCLHLTDEELTHTQRELVRTWSKQHALCIVRDCAAPRVTAAFRHGKVNGFVHMPGSRVAHDPMETLHSLALEQLATLVHYDDGLAPRLEAATADGSRRADVGIFEGADLRVALEVQYSSLSVAHWKHRHESYRQQGILDVWLLGAGGEDSGRPANDQVAVSDLAGAILESGQPLLWIDPANSRLLTARGVADFFGHRHPDPDASSVDVVSEPYDAVRVTRDGIVTAVVHELRRSERRRQGAARAAARRRAALVEGWPTSPLRARVTDLFGGELPDFVTRVSRDSVLGEVPGLWRCAVIEAVVLDAEPAHSKSFMEVVGVVRPLGVHTDTSSEGRSQMYSEIRAFLIDLERNGLVRVELESRPVSRSSRVRRPSGALRSGRRTYSKIERVVTLPRQPLRGAPSGESAPPTAPEEAARDDRAPAGLTPVHGVVSGSDPKPAAGSDPQASPLVVAGADEQVPSGADAMADAWANAPQPIPDSPGRLLLADRRPALAASEPWHMRVRRWLRFG